MKNKHILSRKEAELMLSIGAVDGLMSGITFSCDRLPGVTFKSLTKEEIGLLQAMGATHHLCVFDKSGTRYICKFDELPSIPKKWVSSENGLVYYTVAVMEEETDF